jgi:REP element-mobilizing transposase RayT
VNVGPPAASRHASRSEAEQLKLINLTAMTTTTSKGSFKLSGPWYSRGYLPHFDGESIPQFVTWRLADTLPKRVLESYQAQLKQGSISDVEYYELVERYLDRSHGRSFLRIPAIGGMIQENLIKFDGVKYKLHAWVIMPNHGHVLLTPEVGVTLSSIMHSAKSYTANRANELLNRSGSFWAREYFDRHIRNSRHFTNTLKYIHDNPVKARLCSNVRDWPFSSARFLEM